MKNYRKSLLSLFLILLPWQTRWIFEGIEIFKGISEYGKLSIYAFDIILVLFLLSSVKVLSDRFKIVWNKSKLGPVLIKTSLALTTLALISSAWSPENHVALVFSAHALLATLLILVIVIDDEITPDIVLGGLAIGLIMPSLLGWIQTANQNIQASSLLGIAAQDPKTLGTAVIESGQDRWLRAYATFPHPNIMGGFAAIGLLSAFAVTARRRVKQSEMIMLLAAALIGGVLVMTASRTAMIAFALATTWMLFALKTTRKKDQIKSSKSTIAISLTAMVIIGIFMSPILLNRLDSNNRLEEKSIAERSTQLEDMKALWTESPKTVLVGRGAGNYVFSLSRLHPLQKYYAYQPVHNVPGLILVELGLLGAIILLGIILSSMWLINKHWHETPAIIGMSLSIAMLVLALGDHYLWTSVSGLYLAAIVLALNYRLGEEASRGLKI